MSPLEKMRKLCESADAISPMFKADLALMIKVCDAAQWFTKDTSANFDFPQLEKLKTTIQALTQDDTP